MPIEWSDDGWPRIPEWARPGALLPKPPGVNVGHGMQLSDSFESESLAIQWDPLTTGYSTEDFQSGGGVLRVKARGHSPQSAARLAVLPVNTSFEAQVEIRTAPGTEGGLVVLGETGVTGLGTSEGTVFMHRRGRPTESAGSPGAPVFLKFRNIDHDVEFFHSTDGEQWTKFSWGASLSTESPLRIAIYASGEGFVEFRDFRYRGL